MYEHQRARPLGEPLGRKDAPIYLLYLGPGSFLSTRASCIEGARWNPHVAAHPGYLDTAQLLLWLACDLSAVWILTRDAN